MNTREDIIKSLKSERAKAVFVESHTHLCKDGITRKESLIYFKPRLFGKSTTKTIVEKLGLKTKDDCKKFNQELEN